MIKTLFINGFFIILSTHYVGFEPVTPSSINSLCNFRNNEQVIVADLVDHNLYHHEFVQLSFSLNRPLRRWLSSSKVIPCDAKILSLHMCMRGYMVFIFLHTQKLCLRTFSLNFIPGRISWSNPLNFLINIHFRFECLRNKNWNNSNNNEHSCDAFST